MTRHTRIATAGAAATIRQTLSPSLFVSMTVTSGSTSSLERLIVQGLLGV